MMKLLPACALLASAAIVHAQVPVLNPANGHYYEVVSGFIDWDSAKAAAENMTYLGFGGHLAAVSDAAEKDFLVTLGADRPWLGGYQDVTDPGYSEPGGAWKWVTGEPFVYTNWAPGEPNNLGYSGGDENCIEMFSGGEWNDTEASNPFTSSYIVEYDSATATIYCTAKVNTLGCTPAIGFSGAPSASSPNPFDVSATNVLNNKPGMLFYGYSPAAIPFQGGHLCVQPPIKRTPPQSSGGNPPPSDCSGTYAYDMNARIQSGIDPGLTVGTSVYGQYWSRDPSDPHTTNLTDALEFLIGA